MIDLTVTASDDVESSANVEWNFQRLFPSMHEQAANASADCLSFNHKLPFLFFFVILQFSSQAFSNRSVAKCYGLTGNINLLRIAPHPGESAPRPMTVAVASL